MKTKKSELMTMKQGIKFVLKVKKRGAEYGVSNGGQKVIMSLSLGDKAVGEMHRESGMCHGEIHRSANILIDLGNVYIKEQVKSISGTSTPLYSLTEQGEFLAVKLYK